VAADGAKSRLFAENGGQNPNRDYCRASRHEAKAFEPGYRLSLSRTRNWLWCTDGVEVSDSFHEVIQQAREAEEYRETSHNQRD